MDEHTAMSQPHEYHPEVGHVVPIKLLVGVLAVLMGLTVLTVLVSYVDLGPFNFAVAMLIAMTKATLVALFFMHLRWDKPFNAVLFVCGLGFLLLFIGFCVLDLKEAQPTFDPNSGRLQQFEHDAPGG